MSLSYPEPSKPSKPPVTRWADIGSQLRYCHFLGKTHTCPTELFFRGGRLVGTVTHFRGTFNKFESMWESYNSQSGEVATFDNEKAAKGFLEH